MTINGTHQFLVEANDVNLVGKDINSTNQSTESLVVTIKKVNLEMNAENTRYTNQKE